MWDQKRSDFGRNFSSVCLHVCKFFSAGCAPQKGPEGSIVCAKTSLNLLRHSNPEILNFESEKFCVFFSPPPQQKRTHPLIFNCSRNLKIAITEPSKSIFLTSEQIVALELDLRSLSYFKKDQLILAGHGVCYYLLSSTIGFDSF